MAMASKRIKDLAEIFQQRNSAAYLNQALQTSWAMWEHFENDEADADHWQLRARTRELKNDYFGLDLCSIED